MIAGPSTALGCDAGTGLPNGRQACSLNSDVPSVDCIKLQPYILFSRAPLQLGEAACQWLKVVQLPSARNGLVLHQELEFVEDIADRNLRIVKVY